MAYDVVIVGAGPAGLAAACKIKQTNPAYSVCVREKGSEVGAHILSGAVFEPTALNELSPNWQSMSAPLNTPVTDDHILLLQEQKQIRVPGLFAPKTMKNHGNYIISLGNFCRWLATQAESLGVEIFPGFSAAEILYDENDQVMGIATGAPSDSIASLNRQSMYCAMPSFRADPPFGVSDSISDTACFNRSVAVELSNNPASIA